MIFAIFDPSPLSLCINFSFLYLYMKIMVKPGWRQKLLLLCPMAKSITYGVSHDISVTGSSIKLLPGTTTTNTTTISTAAKNNGALTLRQLSLLGTVLV